MNILILKDISTSLPAVNYSYDIIYELFLRVFLPSTSKNLFERNDVRVLFWLGCRVVVGSLSKCRGVESPYQILDRIWGRDRFSVWMSGWESGSTPGQGLRSYFESIIRVGCRLVDGIGFRIDHCSWFSCHKLFL